MNNIYQFRYTYPIYKPQYVLALYQKSNPLDNKSEKEKRDKIKRALEILRDA